MPPTFRDKLSDSAGWIMAGAGFIAVIVITAMMTSVESGLGAGFIFLGLLTGGFSATLVHELGHALGAHIAGWRVWITSVLGVVQRHGHGLTLSTKYSHDAGGYVLASPPDDARDNKTASIIVSAGGPLASVLTGPPVIAALFFLPQGAWRETVYAEALIVSMLAFGVASTFAALATGIPSRGRGGRPNDMQLILDAAFTKASPPDVRGLSWAWGLFEYGVGPDEWPPWMRESVARSAANPWASPIAPLLAFVCALDDGDEAAARHAARRTTHWSGKLTRAYVAAYFDNNAAAADAEMHALEIDPSETSLTLLREFVRARIATLKADTQGAAYALTAISDELNAGAAKPFWARLLHRAVNAR